MILPAAVRAVNAQSAEIPIAPVGCAAAELGVQGPIVAVDALLEGEGRGGLKTCQTRRKGQSNRHEEAGLLHGETCFQG